MKVFKVWFLLVFVAVFLFSCGGSEKPVNSEPEPDIKSEVFMPDSSVEIVQQFSCAQSSDCPEKECMVAACLKGECQYYKKDDNTPCDDGDTCTVGDYCKGGKCVSGENVCESSCVSDEDCRKFDDNDLCNGVYRCINGKCMIDENSVVVCEESKNQCTETKCVPETGECKEFFKTNGTVCDDGDPCTTGDTCQNGECVGASNVCGCTTDSDCESKNIPCEAKYYCDTSSFPYKCKLIPDSEVKCDTSKDEPCKKNVCNPETEKCEFQVVPDGTECDDNDPCTTKSVCKNGKCVAKPEDNVCECEKDEDCPVPENLCLGKYYCDKTGEIYKCKIDESTVVKCDSSNDTDCMKNICNPQTGQCEMTPVADGTTCDDGKACTVSDSCVNGECTAQPKNCDDNNPCTDDFCDEQTGECVHNDNQLPCDDGDLCTENDVCQNGVCVGTPKVCDDKNECTVDFCDQETGECKFENHPPQTPCNDGNLCTINDSCDGNGVCKGTPKSCDDGNICTDDSCDPETGECVHAYNNISCDDGDLCTINDQCENGVCAGVPLNCDDNNPCTDDKCDPETGECVNSNNVAKCDDGNPCTLDDWCVDGICRGKPKECKDSNPCTKDYCDKQTGECVFEPQQGKSCDDGLWCTVNDACTNTGECVGDEKNCNDNNACTNDYCDEENDTCVNEPKPGSDCDDGNPCTKDFCNPDTGECVHEIITPCCGNGIVDENEECDLGIMELSNSIYSPCGTDCKFKTFVITNEPGSYPEVLYIKTDEFAGYVMVWETFIVNEVGGVNLGSGYGIKGLVLTETGKKITDPKTLEFTPFVNYRHPKLSKTLNSVALAFIDDSPVSGGDRVAVRFLEIDDSDDPLKKVQSLEITTIGEADLLIADNNNYDIDISSELSGTRLVASFIQKGITDETEGNLDVYSQIIKYNYYTKKFENYKILNIEKDPNINPISVSSGGSSQVIAVSYIYIPSSFFSKVEFALINPFAGSYKKYTYAEGLLIGQPPYIIRSFDNNFLFFVNHLEWQVRKVSSSDGSLLTEEIIGGIVGSKVGSLVKASIINSSTYGVVWVRVNKDSDKAMFQKLSATLAPMGSPTDPDNIYPDTDDSSVSIASDENGTVFIVWKDNDGHFMGRFYKVK